MAYAASWRTAGSLIPAKKGNLDLPVTTARPSAAPPRGLHSHATDKLHEAR